MNKLNYSKLETQPYLLSNNFFPETAHFLFKARTRMLNVMNNFKKSADDDIYLCPLCESDEDSQEHLLKCEIIDNVANVKYDDIFSQNINKQKIAVEALQKAMNQRKEILDNSNQCIKNVVGC